MSGKLTKKDYEKVLSAEYGFPVFLNDSEFEKLQVSRPAPEIKPTGYQDPFAKVEHKTSAQTQPGVTYNNTHGRNTYNYIHGRTKKATPTIEDLGSAEKPKTSPESSSIGKIQPYEVPGLSAADKADLAKPASMKIGQPVNAGPTKPVMQDTFTAVDFDIPTSGDPINASGPIVHQAPQMTAAMPVLGVMPQWQSDDAEIDQMNAKYAALMAGQ